MMRSTDHSSKLIGGLEALRADGVLCDFTVIAGGLEMNVHRIVLIACSDYFRAMLTGDMRESRQSCVALHGITGVGLQAVIEFMYSSALKVSLENVEEILAAASHLQVTDAVQLCESFLKSSVTFDNYVDILNISEVYSLDTCKTFARSFALNNFESLPVRNVEEFMKLSASQLADILSDDALCVSSEYRLFNIVIDWVRHDLSAREQYIAQVMFHVRLPLCTDEELEMISRVSLLTTNSDCYQLLLEAKDYHLSVDKQPQLQTARTKVRSVHQRLVMCFDDRLESCDLVTGAEKTLCETPIRMWYPCAAVLYNSFYVCGGKSDRAVHRAVAHCYCYDPQVNVWLEQTSMNKARADFALVAFDGHLYAIGGHDNYVAMDAVERFSLVENEWTSVSAISCGVLCHHQASVCGKRIYVSGGWKPSDDVNDSERCVVSYDPVGDLWRDEPPLNYARSHHSMATVRDRLYVVGGNNDEDMYVEMWEPATMFTWTVCRAVIMLHSAHTAAVFDNKIYIVGGTCGNPDYTDGVIEVYSPDDDKFLDDVGWDLHPTASCLLVLPRSVG